MQYLWKFTSPCLKCFFSPLSYSIFPKFSQASNCLLFLYFSVRKSKNFILDWNWPKHLSQIKSAMKKIWHVSIVVSHSWRVCQKRVCVRLFSHCSQHYYKLNILCGRVFWKALLYSWRQEKDCSENHMKLETFVQTCYLGSQNCIYYNTFFFNFEWWWQKNKRPSIFLATDIKI